MEITCPTSFPEVKLEEQPLSLQVALSNKCSNKTQITKSTTWTQKELYLLASFFFYHPSKLISDSSRKKWKVFKIMSEFIQSRNVNQCRSYTRKLFSTFKTVPNINSFFKCSLPKYKLVVGQLKSANSNLYDIPLPSQQECSSQPEDALKQHKVSSSQKSQNQEQERQNEAEDLTRHPSFGRNILVPQIQRRQWANNHLWLLNYQQIVACLANMHYLNCIMELQ